MRRKLQRFAKDSSFEASPIVKKSWAILNNFKRSPNGFTLSALHPGKGARWNEYVPASSEYLDHAEFYHGAFGKPRVIIAHLYGPDAIRQAEIYAKKHGLIVHIPPNPTASWYRPGKCTLVCYSAPGVEVQWYPGPFDADA